MLNRTSTIIIFVLLATSNTVAADTLRIGGMGAGMAMLPILFKLFDTAGEHKLEVIPSLGSNGGLKALADNAIDIAISGRELKPPETSKGLAIAISARTPFVFVTSNAKPGDIKSADVASIFRSRNSVWPDGSAVKVILRPESDTDTTTLARNFPDMGAALVELRQRPELPTAATDQDNADLAESIPGALTASTLTQIKTEQRKLQLVSVDGVTPSVEGLESGSYRYEKPVYFVISNSTSKIAGRFIEFLRSTEGRSALRMAGNLPAAE